MSPPDDLVFHKIDSRDHWIEGADFLGVLSYLLNEARNLPLQVLDFQERRDTIFRRCLLRTNVASG